MSDVDERLRHEIQRLSSLSEHDAPEDFNRRLFVLLRDVRAEIARLRHDLSAAFGALGYPQPAKYDARMSDGSTPICGLCDAKRQMLERAEALIKELEQQRDNAMRAHAEAEGKAERIRMEYEESRNIGVEECNIHHERIARLVEAGDALRALFTADHDAACADAGCDQCKAVLGWEEAKK